MFTCEFCRVKSFLQERGHFRYLLPSRAPQEKKCFYVPYWRFKGMLFSCLEKEIRHRFVDVSQKAVNLDLFPASVGLRSQALKLKFVTPESRGVFLKPTLPFEEVLDMIDRRFTAQLPGPIIRRSHIGDSLSIIYSPFHVDKKLYDSVLNQPVSPDLPEDFDISGLPEWKQKRGLNFLSTLCPHCGWDLDGQQDSLVLNCRNCASVWRPIKDNFVKLNTAHLPEKADDLIYLPFWRIKGNISGVNLDSYADLVRLANLPKVIQTGMEKARFHFWALAFKVRPQNLLPLTRAITLSQPGEMFSPGVPSAPLHPVTLPLKEGVESLEMTVADLIRPKSRMAELLPGIQIEPKSFLLVYLPFHQKHHDLVQPKFNLSINRNMLAHARNI
ncbi:MAG: hypothetical protein JRE14_00890 [Deltaproteobacteria bacterium]|nr:hypothetical protein [Deltaproteobacteria bacterium]MBW2632686.1 hypothetical protein [Deltaproteobacteria bacterium]